MYSGPVLIAFTLPDPDPPATPLPSDVVEVGGRGKFNPSIPIIDTGDSDLTPSIPISIPIAKTAASRSKSEPGRRILILGSGREMNVEDEVKGNDPPPDLDEEDEEAIEYPDSRCGW